MTSLSKSTALMLFCYFRQAERSVHYALTFPNTWPQFRAYYDKAKQTQIATIIGLLKDAGAEPDKAPSRLEIEQNGWLSAVRSLTALLCNPLKRSWSFSRQELAFFSATFERLLRILGYAELRENDELIELRMDCFDCHYVIRRKLIGVSEIRKVDTIEHFGQSKYVSPVTFQDLEIYCP